MGQLQQKILLRPPLAHVHKTLELFDKELPVHDAVFKLVRVHLELVLELILEQVARVLLGDVARRVLAHITFRFSVVLELVRT